MKKLLLMLFILSSSLTYLNAQNWRTWDYKTIPLNENKEISYSSVETFENKDKNTLYIAIRSWFVDNFVNSDAVIKMDDKDSGVLMGKGNFNSGWMNGINYHSVTIKFSMKIDVKNNKIRYKIYGLSCIDKNTSALDGKSHFYSIILKDCYNNIENNKRLKYNKKFLMNTDTNIKTGIIETLLKTCKEAQTEEDW